MLTRAKTILNLMGSHSDCFNCIAIYSIEKPSPTQAADGKKNRHGARKFGNFAFAWAAVYPAASAAPATRAATQFWTLRRDSEQQRPQKRGKQSLLQVLKAKLLRSRHPGSGRPRTWDAMRISSESPTSLAKHESMLYSLWRSSGKQPLAQAPRLSRLVRDRSFRICA